MNTPRIRPANPPPGGLHSLFEGHRLAASGPLGEVALALRKAHGSGGDAALLVFSDDTGRSVDLDIRGTARQVAARYRPQAPATEPVDEPGSLPQTRGRGRPRLGVVSREVTLLPRHWEWLSDQPGGASVALRRLVEEARRSRAALDAERRARERAYHFMQAMGGDLPGFEEASRALFAGQRAQLARHLAQWPRDVTDYALRLAGP